MAEDKWEDVPEEEISRGDMSDSGWEDVLEDDSIQASETNPVGSSNPTLGSLVGGLTGVAAKKAVDVLPSGVLQKGAARMALESVGAGRTQAGRKFLKTTLPQEIQKEVLGRETTSLFTPKDLGTKILDEDLWDIESVLGQQKIKGEELQSLLDSVESSKTPKELVERYKSKVQDVYPDVETRAGEKANKSVDKFSKRFEGAPDKNVGELERMKRTTTDAIDYGPSSKKLNNTLQKLEASVFREATEDLIKDTGDADLMKAFKSAKSQTGQMGVLRKIITEDMVRDYMKETGKINFEDTVAILYNRPDILVARKALKSNKLKRGLAKGLKHAGTALDTLKGSSIVRNLPIIGALVGGALTFNDAMAAGDTPGEALGQAVAEEGIESIPVVGPVLSPSKIGYGEDIYKRLEQANLTEEDKLELDRRANPVQKKIEPKNIKEIKKIDNLSDGVEYYKQQDDKKKVLSGFTILDKFTSEAVNELAQKFQQMGGAAESFARPLLKAAESPERTKTALLYGLYQQPAFRELLKRAGSGIGKDGNLLEEQDE